MIRTQISDIKQNILDTARELFFTKGYQNTSVNDIIDKTGSSKGAFYHHFKSKEELLDTITELITGDAMDTVREITNQKTDAITKLNKIFSYSRQYKSANIKLVRMYIEAMYRPSNIILLRRLQEWSWQKIAPYLTIVLTQGKDEGVFDINDVENSVSVLGDLSFGLAKVNAEYILDPKNTWNDTDELVRKNRAYERAFERILGSKPGSIKIIGKEFINLFKD